MAEQPRVSLLLSLIDKITEPLGGIRGQLANFGNAIKGIGATIAASFSVAAFVSFFKSSVEGAIEAEGSISRLGVALKGLGISYAQVAPDIEKYFSKLQQTTRFSDDDGREALVNLITITGDYRKSVDLLSLTADVAAKRHTSMAEAANTVGKAAVGITKGLGDLGVTTTKASDAIAQMRANTAGFAETDGKTFGGRVEILNNLWEEFKEKIGLAIIGNDRLRDSMSDLALKLVAAAAFIEKNSGAIGGFINKVVGFGETVAKVSRFIVEHTPNWLTVAKAVRGLGLAHEETAVKVEGSETKMTAVVTQEGGRRITKTKEEVVAEEEARKKAAAERERNLKASHKSLADLQKVAAQSSLALLSAQHKEYAELTRQFQEKMQEMTAEDRVKAEALLVEAQHNLLLKWAGFGEEQINIVRKTSDTTRQEIVKSTLPYQDFTKILKEHGKILDENARKELAATVSHEQFRQKVVSTSRDIAASADVLLAFANALGLADDSTRQLVTGIADLADGIGRIASGDVAGGLIQGISGLSGAIAGLFGGESASARAVRVELEKTRDALERHRQTLGDLIEVTQPGAKVVGLAGAVGDILKAFKAQQAQGGVAGGLISVDEKTVRRELAKRGLSVDELETLAKDLGLTLKTESGRFSVEKLEILLEEIDARDSGFADTFQGQLDKLTNRWNIIGADVGRKLRDLVDLAAEESPALAHLKDFALNTAEGRQGAIDFLAGLLDRGDLSLEDLGGLNLAQFRDVLAEIAGFIRDVGGSDLVVPPSTLGGPGRSAEGPPVTGKVGDFLPGVEMEENAAVSLSNLIDVEVASRDYLADLAGSVKAWMPGTGSPVGAVEVAVEAPITLNFGAEATGDPQAIAGAVQGVLREHRGELLEYIEQGLAQRYLRSKSLTGDASR